MSDRNKTKNLEIDILIFRGSDKREEFNFRKLRGEANRSVLEIRIPNELVIVSKQVPTKKEYIRNCTIVWVFWKNWYWKW